MIDAKNNRVSEKIKQPSFVLPKPSIVNVNNVDLSHIESGPKVYYQFPKGLQKIIDARNEVNK